MSPPKIVESDTVPGRSHEVRRGTAVIYVLSGMLFGLVLVKGEIISWFRIQEMFRFHAFHMYGVIGTAVLTGLLSVLAIKRFNVRTIDGSAIVVPKRRFHKGQIYGALLFGIGWAITGACPGPLYAQLGAGYLAVGVTLASALTGTLAAGFLNNKLPR